MKMSVHIEEWPLTRPFRISGFEWINSRGIVVQVEDAGCVGRGEAQGVFYLDETAESIFEEVEAVAGEIRGGISRTDLQQLLPAGGARNAVDCALWDLDCKRSGKSIWELTGIEPGPVTTVFTIGLEASPEAMAAKAAAAADSPVLKIKLDSDRPYEKLAAIRAARPDAQLVVDANQGWDFNLLRDVIPKCAALNLGMVEQPLPRGGDREAITAEGIEAYKTFIGALLDVTDNIIGAITGRAIYEGTLDLAEGQRLADEWRAE